MSEPIYPIHRSNASCPDCGEYLDAESRCRACGKRPREVHDAAHRPRKGTLPRRDPRLAESILGNGRIELCKGRRRYATPADASEHLAAWSRYGRVTEVVRCRLCDGFHVAVKSRAS